jgi:gas vesicle protein
MKRLKPILVGFILGLIVGMGLGVNIGKDKPLLSNPFAGRDLRKTIQKTSGKVIEKGGKALEESGKALQKEIQDNLKK